MAKKKNNTVSIADIEKAMPSNTNVKAIEFTNGENSVQILVKQSISLTEYSNMIKDIATMVFVDTGNGDNEYTPYLKRFAIYFEILNYFTNINIPANTNKIWELINREDIMDKIIDAVPKKYIHSILADSAALIDFKKSQIRGKFDEILIGISEIISKIKEKTSNMSQEDLLELMNHISPELKQNLESALSAQIGGNAVNSAV